MAYLVGKHTADWLKARKRGGLDLRSRRKLPRWVPETAGGMEPLTILNQDGDTYIYVPPEPVDGQGMAWVFRNGCPVRPMTAPGEDGLVPVGGVGPGWVAIQIVPAGSNPDWPSIPSEERWEAVFLATLPDDPNPDCNCVIGHVDAQGNILQFHHGPVYSDWVHPDAEAHALDGAGSTIPRSLVRTGNQVDHERLGIWDFPDPAVRDLDDMDAAAQWQLMVRWQPPGSSAPEVGYLSTRLLTPAEIEDIVDILPYVPPYDEMPGCPAGHQAGDVDGVWLWDTCDDDWISLPDGVAKAGATRFWLQGGDETTCRGSGIGNAAGNRVINLSTPTLEGAWHADELHVDGPAANPGIYVGNDLYVPTTIVDGNGVQHSVLAKL